MNNTEKIVAVLQQQALEIKLLSKHVVALQNRVKTLEENTGETTTVDPSNFV